MSVYTPVNISCHCLFRALWRRQWVQRTRSKQDSPRPVRFRAIFNGWQCDFNRVARGRHGLLVAGPRWGASRSCCGTRRWQAAGRHFCKAWHKRKGTVTKTQERDFLGLNWLTLSWLKHLKETNTFLLINKLINKSIPHLRYIHWKALRRVFCMHVSEKAEICMDVWQLQTRQLLLETFSIQF